jgi:hypothetical protein
VAVRVGCLAPCSRTAGPPDRSSASSSTIRANCEAHRDLMPSAIVDASDLPSSISRSAASRQEKYAKNASCLSFSVALPGGAGYFDPWRRLCDPFRDEVSVLCRHRQRHHRACYNRLHRKSPPWNVTFIARVDGAAARRSSPCDAVGLTGGSGSSMSGGTDHG